MNGWNSNPEVYNEKLFRRYQDSLDSEENSSKENSQNERHQCAMCGDSSEEATYLFENAKLEEIYCCNKCIEEREYEEDLTHEQAIAAITEECKTNEKHNNNSRRVPGVLGALPNGRGRLIAG